MDSLKKTFTTKDVLMMSFGSMIGWGWIMMSGVWASQAGMLGAILAFGIGAVFCIFVGLVYAELTPAIPFTGGGVVFSYQAFGPGAASIAGLATIFAYLGVAAWEGPALSSAMEYLVTIPHFGYLWTINGFDVYLSWASLAIAISVLLSAINYVGSKATAILQTVSTIGKVAVGILFVIGAVLFGSRANVDTLVTDMKGFSAVLLTVPAMFVGFDIIPQSAGEMNMSVRKIPAILISSILAAAAWYMLMIFATSFSAPSYVYENADIPVADAMAYALGHPFWAKVCIFGALCGILSCWNGFLYAAARCMYSMAVAGLLPAVLARIHPRFGTPYVSILVCSVFTTFSCLLGKSSLTWLLNASSFSVVIMYAVVVAAFIRLRISQPLLPRPYRVANWKTVSVMAVLVVLFFVYLYLPFGPSPLCGVEWGMVLGWFVIGILLTAFSLRKTSDWSPEQRREKLFRK